MTATTLKNYSCKDLAQMAKVQGVVGWHAMRKEELVEALAKRAKQNRQRGTGAPLELPPVNGDPRKTAIKNRSADSVLVTTGSLYPALHRLERQKLL